MITKKFSVTGMTCAACQASVERAVSALPDVSDAAVSLMTHSMTVTYDENHLSEDAIFKAVSDAGYGASEWVRRDDAAEKEDRHVRSLLRRFLLSAVFAVLMMAVSMGPMLSLPLPAFMDPHGGGTAPLVYAAVQLVLTIPVILINFAYFTDGFRAALHRSPNMNTLVGLGAAASFLYGLAVFIRMLAGYANGSDIRPLTHELYFESVTMILTLITLGRWLEARARRHTTDAVRALMALTPKTAEVIRGGQAAVIPSDELRPGDVVIVRSGSSVPCDGVIRSGGGAADESVITGESLPVTKEVGDSLIAGTLLTTGYVTMEAVSVGDDTTVSKITALVEDAASSKAPVQKLADRISGIFVPTVCLIALVTFVLWAIFGGSFSRAVGFGISVLVISCPCALGLATPTAIMCGVGRGASLGILIKSADAIDVLDKATVAVFDKTGTITEGAMRVSSVVPFGYTEEELYRLAASLEAPSEHPIGAAIVSHAAEKGVDAPAVSDFTQTFGGGVSGSIDGVRCLGGSRDYLASVGISIPADASDAAESLAAEGQTPVFFARDGRLVGIIALADAIRPSSREAITRFRSLGFDAVMLTGDCETTACAVAKEAGIDTILSGVKPDEKSAAIEHLMDGTTAGDGKRRYVLMIGDGVNDAPALAMADCGIAVSHGTDIALESAGVVLVRSDLCDAARAVELSHTVMRNIRENLGWAFGYNLLCIPLAAGVLFPAFGIALTPMIASLAMSLSSVCVVTNALRLRRFQPES